MTKNKAEQKLRRILKSPPPFSGNKPTTDDEYIKHQQLMAEIFALMAFASGEAKNYNEAKEVAEMIFCCHEARILVDASFDGDVS